ncbi:hypothetical protein B0H17DRAFT_887529, partial [Mycena rosella]
IADVLKLFKLNKEPQRAFEIVTDHAAGSSIMPLRMYMGGIGGTGKSRVIHAIIEFFTRRHEEYRFMVLGPTGSTAALLNGSTYHSVYLEGASLAAVNERLQGVNYIFLDKCSV